MSNPKTLGEWLKSKRRAMNLSRELVAELIGTSATTIGNIENGGSAMFDTVRRLAHSLGAKLADLDRFLPKPEVELARVRPKRPTEGKHHVIQAEYEAGVKQKELAKKYGVTISAISRIVNKATA